MTSQHVQKAYPSTALRTRPLTPDRVREAVRVVSDAFWPTPSNVAVFNGRTDAERRRQQAAMEILLRRMPGEVLLAMDGDEVVGVLRHVDSGRCQPRGLTKLRVMPRMVLALRQSLPRFGAWFSTWERHDPQRHHDHLGPVAVRPDRQGRRVGSFLLGHFVEDLDRRREPGYLETEQEPNVRLYRRFGFEVVAEVPVLGIPTWLMWREPKPQRTDA